MPPNVLGAPKPTSSVMISSTFGAPLGGTIRGGHQAFDCAALRSITPPNFGAGKGRTLEFRNSVALGEPGTPVICWAEALLEPKPAMISSASTVKAGTAF